MTLEPSDALAEIFDLFVLTLGFDSDQLTECVYPYDGTLGEYMVVLLLALAVISLLPEYSLLCYLMDRIKKALKSACC